MSNGEKRFFGLSLDTGMLFAMLVAAVYFGAMMRAELDGAIQGISRIEMKVNRIVIERNSETRTITELTARINELDRIIQGVVKQQRRRLAP